MTEEASRARQLYYQDSYGRLRRDRQAGRAVSSRSAAGTPRPAAPGWPVLKVLLILAALVVLASFVR